jgi:nitrogenase molybdenum-iron protein alpha/beta subunit
MAAEKNPAEELKSGKRKTNKDGLFFMQCAEFAAPFILRILSTIKDVAVIVHSPAGCAASFADFNRRYRIGQLGCRDRRPTWRILPGNQCPYSGRLVLDRSYAGYRGGLRLAEDIYSTILNDSF